MPRPTKMQLSIMKRVAQCGWDVVAGGEILSARSSPFLHEEIDWEAGDPEHGDVRHACRLTDEGARYLQEHEGMMLSSDPDGSWVIA